LKKEIVTFGDPSVMPTKMVGKYVKPKDWNALISDPDIVSVSSIPQILHCPISYVCIVKLQFRCV